MDDRGRPHTLPNPSAPGALSKAKHESTKTRKEQSVVGHRFEQLSHEVIEAAIDGHRELGPGFLESIYESALTVALRHRGIAYDTQKEVTIHYLGEEVGMHGLNIVVDEQIVVELKAVNALEDIHFAQLRSYLKATRIRVGQLLNFNAPTLVVKRVVYD